MPFLKPYYSTLISCGLFGIADDFVEKELSLDQKFQSSHYSIFYVRASGDSMSPEIKNDDILIIDRSKTIANGQVGTFYYEGNAICKRYFITTEGIVLKSDNKKYVDINVHDDELHIFGVVIGVVRDFR